MKVHHVYSKYKKTKKKYYTRRRKYGERRRRRWDEDSWKRLSGGDKRILRVKGDKKWRRN